MIKVRDLVGGTQHSIYGPMARGLFRDIKPEHFNATLFEIIPANEYDYHIIVPNIDSRGKTISGKKTRAIRIKMFNRYKKLKKTYELENKLAIKRLQGRK